MSEEPSHFGVVAGAGFPSEVRMVAVDAPATQFRRRCMVAFGPGREEWLTQTFE
jgi:hypothetical protein